MIGPVNHIDRALAEVEFVSIFRDGYSEIAFRCHCVRTPNYADWCNVHERLPEPLRRLTQGLGMQLEAPGDVTDFLAIYDEQSKEPGS